MMQPATYSDISYRVHLSQRLAALLSVTVACATLLRPLIAELNPWLTIAGLLNSALWWLLYRLIDSGKLNERAPLLLNGSVSTTLLLMLALTGGANSHLAVLLPLVPMLAMMLGGASSCLLVGVGWGLVLSLNLLAPELVVDWSGLSYDRDSSNARGLWLLLATMMCTVFSLYVDRSLTQLRYELKRQATVDPLTGLLNRRGLLEGVAWEFARAARTQQPLAVLIADVDQFKRFNDAHGHEAGDRALQRIARTLKASVRAGQDLVTRHGGEEFVLVFTNSDAAATAVAAEHVRRAVATMGPVCDDQRDAITLTMGYAVLEPPMALQMPPEQRQAQFEELLRRADAALYEGKANGRDQVVIAS